MISNNYDFDRLLRATREFNRKYHAENTAVASWHKPPTLPAVDEVGLSMPFKIAYTAFGIATSGAFALSLGAGLGLTALICLGSCGTSYLHLSLIKKQKIEKLMDNPVWAMSTYKALEHGRWIVKESFGAIPKGRQVDIVVTEGTHGFPDVWVISHGFCPYQYLEPVGGW